LGSLNQEKLGLRREKMRLTFTSETETTGKQERRVSEEEKKA
jgi:hypothetical protein